MNVKAICVPKMPFLHSSRRRAIALLLTLILVGVVAVIVAEFSHTSNLELFRARNLYEAAAADYAALGAVEYTKQFILQSLAKQGDSTIDLNLSWLSAPVTVDFSPLSVEVLVTDEQGKLDLNLLGLEDEKSRTKARSFLANLLGTYADGAGLDEMLNAVEERREALQAERDKKKGKGRSGSSAEKGTEGTGEEDSGKPPAAKSAAKRGAQTEAEEADRGTAEPMERVILFHIPEEILQWDVLKLEPPEGAGELETIRKELTTWSDGRLNINTASESALLAVGFKPETVQSILERRAASPFKKLSELSQELKVPAGELKTLSDYLTTTSSYFSLQIKISGDRVRRRYEAVIRVQRATGDEGGEEAGTGQGKDGRADRKDEGGQESGTEGARDAAKGTAQTLFFRELFSQASGE